MPKTVVGLFKSLAEAQAAKQTLASQGFAASDLRVVANDETAGYAAGAGSQTSQSSETGFMSSVQNFFKSFTGADESDRDYYTQGVSRGGALLTATVADGQADALVAKLEQLGAADVNEESGRSAVGTSGAQVSGAAGAVIPVVEEDLKVGKRQVQRGGVRVYSHVVETPVQESVQLREEHVRVQRSAVDRPASEADFQTFKEGSIELTESAEEAVVSKQARVVEEVTIGKEVSERTETVKDTLRRTEVEVEDLTTGTKAKSQSASKL